MRAARAAIVAIGLCASAATAEARGVTPRAWQAASETVGAPLELHPLVAEARRFLGQGNFTGYREAWCADAISYWLRSIGLRPLPNHMASSALAYGPHMQNPKPGALVVMRGHVGLVEVVNADGSIVMISGNYSHRVKEARISRYQVVAFVSAD